MSKARMQPSAKTGLVFKISIALFFLLALVLYKINDYFKQEKWVVAQNQLRTQIISTKTSVSSQIAQLRNVLSSFETEINESKLNWVQLDPFFAIASGLKVNEEKIEIHQFVGRSGTVAERWNASYLEKALQIHSVSYENPITTQLFQDKSGSKYLSISFAFAGSRVITVVGSADYFQKFFDLERGGKSISFLKNTEQMIAAHTESDYVATLAEEEFFKSKNYLFEKEEIAGTNLIAVSYLSKKVLGAGFVTPWSVVGLIVGFGMILIAILYYSLDPIERKVERYKKQERDQVFKETLQENLQASAQANKPTPLADGKTVDDFFGKVRADTVQEVKSVMQNVLTPTPTEDLFSQKLSTSSIMAPLQQAMFNLDSLFKATGVVIEKDISTTLAHEVQYAGLIKAFENILKNSAEAVQDQKEKKIKILAYDIEQNTSVVEIRDSGLGLPDDLEIEKLWQPFFTTKSKTNHMGLGLTEALSLARQSGAELTIERQPGTGLLIKLIMKKQVKSEANTNLHILNESTNFTHLTVGGLGGVNLEKTQTRTAFVLDEFTQAGKDDLLDLEKALSMDDIEADDAEQVVQSAMTSQKFKTSSTTASEIKKPDFLFEKKDFLVDQFPTKIRRPEKS